MISKKLFFGAILALLLCGCDKKVVQRNPHELKRDEPTQVMQSENLQQCMDLLKSKNFSEKICGYQEKDLLEMEAAELYTIFSKTDFLRDPEIYSRSLVPRLIWSLNQYAIEKGDVQLQYNLVELMRKDCKVFGEDPCLTYKIFSSVSTTKDIFLNFLKDSKNKNEISEIFLLAFRATNNSTDNRIYKIFAQRVTDVPSDSRLILILKSNQRDDLDALTKQKIFTYISPGVLRLSHLLSREEISQSIVEYKKKAKRQALSASIEQIRQYRPLLLKALGVEKIQPGTLTDIFDLVFENIVSDREDNQSLKYFGNDDVLMKGFKEYVQLRLAFEIHQNDLYVLEAVEKNNVDSSEYTRRLNEKLETVRHRWSMLSNNLKSVSLWMSGALSGNKSAPKKYISGLDSTIRTYSEYPHMMYVAYAQSLLGIPWIVQVVTPVASHTTSIEAKNLFTNIFFPPEGKMQAAEKVTWLKYTNYDEANHLITIRNSLLYFLSSGALEVFKINREKFLALLVSSLQQEYTDLPRQRLENITKFYEYNSDYKDFSNFCEDFMSGKTVRRVIPFEKLKAQLLMASFETNVLQPISFGGAVNVSVNSGGLPFDLTTGFDLQETVTTDVEKVQDLLGLVKKTLQKVGAPASSAIENSLKDLVQLRTSAEQSMLQWQTRGACFVKILEEERAILHYIIEKEASYLRQVYSDMKSLRSVATPREAQSILEKYKKSYLFEPLAQRGIKPLDRISTKGYFYSQFDLLGRISFYLQSYSPRIKFDIKLPETISKTSSYNLVAQGIGQTNWLYYPSSLSEEKFINEVYRTIQNENYFVSWSDTLSASARLDRLQIYMLNLVSMSRFVPELSSATLLTEFKKMLKYTQLTELEKKLLMAGGRDTMWNLIQLDGWLVDVKKRESSVIDKGDVINASKDTTAIKKDQVKVSYLSRIYGLFDTIYELYCADVLGFDYYVDDLRSQEKSCEGNGCGSDGEASKKYRAGPYGQALEFYLSLQNVETKELIFPLDKRLVKETYSKLRSGVHKKEEQEKAFYDLIQRSYSAAEDYVDISLSLQVTSPAISLRSKTKVEGNRADFHLKTQNCFHSQRPKNCIEADEKKASSNSQ